MIKGESWSLIFFFFSSRRRHTRCGRDWSSDVCSSDLRVHFEAVTEVVGNRSLVPKIVRLDLSSVEELDGELVSTKPKEPSPRWCDWLAWVEPVVTELHASVAVVVFDDNTSDLVLEVTVPESTVEAVLPEVRWERCILVAVLPPDTPVNGVVVCIGGREALRFSAEVMT